MPIQIVPSGEEPTGISCDALVIGAVKSDGSPRLVDGDALDQALDGQLSEYLNATNFKANVGEMVEVPTLGRLPASSLVVVGLGAASEVDPSVLRRASGTVGRRLAERKTIATTLSRGAGADGASAAAEGFILGSYRFTVHKSDPKPSSLERVSLLGDVSEQTIEHARARAEATILARDLTNEPASSIYPQSLAQRAKDLADVAGFECTIFGEKELAEKGFGGILGVAQGSEKPPRFIQMRYRPSDPQGFVILVGKGITFDSGGLSLKDAKSMEQMKTDMAGAAAVIGAMSAMKRLDVKVEVLGLVSSSENLPSGTAIKPGDVLVHYGGQTAEVNNTDAEGRLVLADAIAFACEQQPDAILDIATLTGAIMVALGAKATGFFSNNDDLAREIDAAAQTAGERFWRMPIYDDYRKDLDSEVADIKNSGPRYGGAIMGALYLKDFVKNDVPWAHLDIAGPSRAESDYDEVSRGGTGVATRTLLAWVEGRGR